MKTKKNTLMKRVIFEHPGDPKGSYLRVRDEGDKILAHIKNKNLENFISILFLNLKQLYKILI